MIFNRKYIIIFFASVLMVLTSCDNPRDVESLSLSSGTLTMQVGETKQLELLMKPLSATAYNSPSWESSDMNVARVDSRGNITAVYTGECVITASCGEIEDNCVVTVKAPEHSFSANEAYSRAIVDEGNAMSNSFVLRLLSQGLSLDTTSNVISGNGKMISLQLKSSIDNSVLDTGRYTVSSSDIPLTFEPGEIIENGGKYYVTGSFLGEYSNEGMGAVTLVQGNVHIGENGINAYLVGELGELVQCSFDGDIINYGSNSGEIESVEFQYVGHTITDAGFTANDKRSLLKLTVQCSDNVTIVQHLVVPISSVPNVPLGVYETSDTEQNFSIYLDDAMPELNPTISSGGGSTIGVSSGHVIVGEKDGEMLFDIQYRDGDGRIVKVEGL